MEYMDRIADGTFCKPGWPEKMPQAPLERADRLEVLRCSWVAVRHSGKLR